MSVDLSWGIPGEDFRQLTERFTNLERSFDDFREPFGDMMGVLEDEARYRFASQGAHGTGEKWHKLDTWYAARKAAKYGTRPILMASGALARSLTDRKDPNALAVIKKLEMARGSKLQVGKAGEWNLGLLHQLGAPRANLPIRRILALSKRAQGQISDIFARWFYRQGEGRI